MVQLDYPTDGTVISAGDHIDRVSFMLSNKLRLIYDNSLTTTNQNNYTENFFSSDNMTAVNMMYDSGSDYYYLLQVDDEIDDSNLTANWTTDTSTTGTATASVTENADRIRCATNATTDGDDATATCTSDGTSPIDYYNSNNDCYFKFRLVMTGDSGNASDTVSGRFGLTDGTNTVWLETKSASDGANLSDDSVWEVFINAAANTADTYDDGVLDTADIDISSVNLGNYYFVFQSVLDSNGAGGSVNSMYTDLYYLYSMGVGYGAGTITQTTATSLSASSDIIISSVYDTITEGETTTPSVSFNNGSNYTAGSSDVLQQNTNAGTQLKHKITVTAPTTITPAGNKVFGRVDGYNAYYSA